MSFNSGRSWAQLVAMSQAQRTRLQLRAAAQAAAAAAANAQAALNQVNQAAIAAGLQAHPAAAPGGIPGPPAPAVDVGLVLAQLMQQQALQNAAMQAQQASANANAELAAADALAQSRRAGAGPAPLFHGMARDIAVHTWLIALERWFEVAHIEAIGADAERIEVASAALRGSAQAWWEATRSADAAQVAAGGQSAVGTWTGFTAAVRQHFLPQAPQRWALQQLELLKSGNNVDVARYTDKFVELDQLVVPPQLELARVMAYEQGLPESYRVKSAEKQHATLHAAMESTLALWNAKKVAQGQVPRPQAKLNSTQDAEMSEGEDEAPQRPLMASADPFQQAMLQQMAALTAAFTSGFNRGGGGRSGGRGGSGRSRQPREGNKEGSDSRSRSRTPGVSEEIAQERIKAGLCIRCGEKAGAGHWARTCTNPVKSTN